MIKKTIFMTIAFIALVPALVNGQSVNVTESKIDAPKVPSSQAKTVTATPRVLDRLDLDTSRITGAREQPKVTAIVPWKAADARASSEPVFRTLVNEALKPLDRDDFARETAYFEVLKNSTPKASSAKQSPPATR